MSSSRPKSNALWMVSALALTVLAFCAWLGYTEYRARSAPKPIQAKHHPPMAHASPVISASGASPLADQPLPIPYEVQPGETLTTVLTGLGLEYPEALEVTAIVGEKLDPRRVQAGTPYTAVYGPENQLEAFTIEVAREGEIMARRQGAGWGGAWRQFQRRVEIRTLAGSLEGALETSIRNSGGSPVLTYAMADALQWDLDFNRDLRLGDTFQVVYEQVYLDGVDQGPGRVLALKYTNLGRTLEAYRFGEEEGFYDGEGRPLRKMFLRSPLRYSRITSGFSHSRFHPILKKNRPHWGVDYGAPVGTPVRATAAGVVTRAAWSGGGGRTVKIRHPNDYETAYLHLSRYAKGIRSGRRVAQGEVVGYVGSSGLSTGPHLDYRVRHQGRWINPTSLKGVPARPIAQKELPRFVRWRNALRESLTNGEPPPASELALALEGSGSQAPVETTTVAADGPAEPGPAADAVTAGR